MQTLAVRWPFGLWQRQKVSHLGVGWIALTTVILSGATYASFGKQLTGALSPISLLFFSEGLTLIFTILSFGCVPLVRSVLNQNKKTLIPILIIGILNSVIAPLLGFIGLRTTSAVNAELFMRAELLFLAILAAVFLSERMRKVHLIAGGSIILGLVIIALRGMTEEFIMQPGDGYLLLSALTYSVGGIIFKKYVHDVHPEVVVFCRTVIAMCFFFGVSPLLEHNLIEELHTFPSTLLFALIGYAFISRFVNLFAFYEAMDRLPVRTISLVLPVEVIFSLAFAHLYLGEPVMGYHFIGGGLILGGMLLLRIFSLMGDHKKLASTLKHQHRQHL